MRPRPAKDQFALQTTVWYIGIDPGANGGVAAISEQSVEWRAMTPSRLMLAQFLEDFPFCNTVAVVELNSSSPQMGVASAFTFGKNCERPCAMLSALGILYEEIRPQVWQKFLHIPPRKKAKNGKGGETNTQWKDRLLSKAQQMFPGIGLWEQTKTVQKAICDALLIAEYCRRIQLGQ